MASKELRTRILDALGRLLEPIALLLLKSGITWREFADLAKVKFVQVATKLRVPTSERPVFAPGFMSKPTQVLDGWFHDPNFRAASGEPRDLQVSEGEDSFAALVRRYVPGIPHVAMIKELRAVGAIEELPDGRLRALKRNYIPRELADNQIRLWGSVLEDVGTTLEHNVMRKASERPRFERRALSLTVARRALPEFETFLAAEGQAFLERIDDWLAAHQVDSSGEDTPPTLRLGVGVYQILSDTRSRRRGAAGD